MGILLLLKLFQPPHCDSCVASSRQLGVSETEIATLKSAAGFLGNSLTRHREFARNLLGFQVFDEAAEQKLRATAAVFAAEAVSVDKLVEGLLHWLIDQRYVLPGDRRIRDIAREAFQSVEDMCLATIRGAIPAPTLAKILHEMFEASCKPGLSTLEWLRLRLGKAAPGNLNEVCQRVTYLRAMGVGDWDLGAISVPRLQAFAQRVVNRAPAETSRRLHETQTVEIVCFLKHTLAELTDETIHRSNRQAGALMGKGRAKVNERKASRYAVQRECLKSIRDLALDGSKPLQQRLDAVVSLVDESLALGEVTEAAAARDELIERNSQVRDVLDALACVDLQGKPGSKDVLIVEAYQGLKASKVTKLPLDFDVSNFPPSWREALQDADRSRAWKAMQACAMESVRSALNGGRLWVPHSKDFRSRDELLIPEAEWQRDKETLCLAHGLETDCEKFLASIKALLQDGLSELTEAVEKGFIEIDEENCVRVPKFSPLDIDPAVAKVNDALLSGRGTSQLPDVMLQIDKDVGFSKVVLGRLAKDGFELTRLYGAMIAYGRSIEAKSVAAMIPGLAVADVTAGMRLLESPKLLRAANDRVVDYQQRFPIVKAWGDGTKASSDMMALEATHHVHFARQNHRRKTMTTGGYFHVLDSHAIGYHQHIFHHSWQAAAAVHGTREYNASRPKDRAALEMLAVDTHGYTHAAMAVAKLLQFDLCPHLAHLPDRRLYLPKSVTVPEQLEGIVKLEISETAIQKAWDQILRVMASICAGRVSAHWVISRSGSDAKGDPVHKGLEHLGKLLLPLFLCDYHTNPEFRREVRTLLNRGESVHFLHRTISPTRMHHSRGRRAAEVEAIVGAQTLLTNIVLAYQTREIQSSVDRLSKVGQKVSMEILRHVSPGRSSDINLNGTMTFSVDEYAQSLLEPAAKQRRSA